MPTGSGKTAVLMLTAFQERARRLLVITPSRLVRNQIASDFKELRTIRKIGALPETMRAPTVHEITRVLGTNEAWAALEEFEVVVGTPNSISPAMTAVAAPPPDLFDLILIDEAHHRPAPTWDAVLKAFPGARRAAFTATPFRRDKKQVEGEIVFNYPLSRAYADGVYGQIEYVEVHPNGQSADSAIARTTEEVFRRDEADGLEHYVVVRTDSRPRADQLAELYRAQTGLRLTVIHSGHSSQTSH
jgi:superfamily II DNA or RNA helicase